jgi:hypothetical protein
MTKEQLEKMSAFDGEILLADGFDECVVGMTLSDDEWVALYDATLVVNQLARDMPYECAMEFFEFNIEGAYMGKKTPVFIFMDQADDTLD